jgi:hypothetical protein
MSRVRRRWAGGGKMPRSGKAITDVELLSLEEDTLDIVVTWNQLAVPGDSAQDGSEQTDWRMMSGMFAVDNLTVGAFRVPAAGKYPGVAGQIQPRFSQAR